jgi:hypothetical protein
MPASVSVIGGNAQGQHDLLGDGTDQPQFCPQHHKALELVCIDD